MPHESEAITRRKRIDPKLKALGWVVVPYVEGMDVSQLTNHAVEEYPTANGPADYALFVNGKLLGIVEAKRLAVGVQNVLEQAKRYSQGVMNGGAGNWNGYRVPFLYLPGLDDARSCRRSYSDQISIFRFVERGNAAFYA